MDPKHPRARPTDGTRIVLRCLSRLPLLLVFTLHGCGGLIAGMAVYFNSLDDSGDNHTPNATPEIRDLQVSETRTSPARITFTVADREGDPVAVSISYTEPPPAPAVPVPIRLTGDDTALEGLSSSRAGTTYTRWWDYEHQAEAGAGYAEGYTITAQVGVAVVTKTVNCGNDPPAVALPVPRPEGDVSGIVSFPFLVSDSSGDVVSVMVEYAVAGTEEESGEPPQPCDDTGNPCDPADRPISGNDQLPWRIARPAGWNPAACTPTFADRIPAPREWSDHLDFFWDSLADLGNRDLPVKLRFTACDGLAWSESVEVDEVFRVDNNEAPNAFLEDLSLVLNPDRGRGIPIPFEVWDAEDDPVRLVFQWRLDSQESFFDDVDLEPHRDEIERILADPAARRQMQIATEKPREVTGRLVPVNDTAVRLPELAHAGSVLLAKGLEGRELDIMRPATLVESPPGQWDLHAPVAALPWAQGITAVVLDSPQAGSWRLRELNLATGAVVKTTVGSGAGSPSAMTFEREATTALVAADTDGAWSVWRVDCTQGGDPSLLVSAEEAAGAETIERGTIRSILSLGEHVALVTLGSSLVRLAFPPGDQARAAALVSDLATPWGMVLDPFAVNRVLLAEHGGTNPDPGSPPGRILAIATDTLAITPVRAVGSELPRPSCLALDRWGTHLLAVCDKDPGDGTQELRGIDRSQWHGFQIAAGLPEGIGSAAAGAHGLTIVSLTAADRLARGGGLEQRRAIHAFDQTTLTVTVDPLQPFEPPVTALKTWRILDDQSLVTPVNGVVRGIFVWDSHDVPSGNGRVVVRVVPYDSERGGAGSSRDPRSVVRYREVPRALLPPERGFGIHAVIAADLDGDGDLDLVSVDRASKAITGVFQQHPGVYGGAGDPPRPDFSLGSPESLDDPHAVTAADLDQDGDLDLVSANRGSNSLTVFFQTNPGEFGQPGVTLGGSLATAGPRSVAAADLDRDGDMDLVSANTEGDTLTIFFQKSPGVFGNGQDPPQPDTTLGGAATTDGPSTVVAADLNGDGDVDLLSANAQSDTVTIFFQKSPGVFGAGGSPGLPDATLGGVAMAGDRSAVAVADLDRDGSLDILSASTESHTLSLFLQKEPGVFGNRADPALPDGVLGSATSTADPRSVATGDLDGDGDVDILSANFSGDTVTVFFQKAPGVYGARGDPAEPDLTLGTRDTTPSPASIMAIDLDNDGDLDILSGSAASNTMNVFHQRFRGSLLDEGDPTQPDVVLGGPGATDSPRSVAAADIDRDGDLDLISANRRSNTLTVFLQRSPGVFGWEGDPAQPNLTLGGPESTLDPRSVVAADLDGNMYVDLVSANYSGNCLTVFSQLSPGVFGKSGNPAQPNHVLGGEGITDRPAAVVAADLDRDGDLDLIAALSQGQRLGSLGIFLQEGSGSGVLAAEPVQLAAAHFPNSLATADVDSDGAHDLISVHRRDNGVKVFFQNGWEPVDFTAQPLASIQTPAAGLCADLNRDGYLEIVAANYWGHTLTICYQETPRVFEPDGERTLRVGCEAVSEGPASLAAADVDGDGTLDLISGNDGLSTLAVFYQRTPGEFGGEDGTRADLSLGCEESTAAPSSVLAVDLDGDGDLDLVVATAETLAVFYGGH